IIKYLVAALYIVPLFASFPLLLFEYSTIIIDNRVFVLTLSDTGNNIQRITSSTVYFFYAIICLVLTGGSIFNLSKFSTSHKVSIMVLAKQQSLFTTTAICCVIHILKAVHQVRYFQSIVCLNYEVGLDAYYYEWKNDFFDPPRLHSSNLPHRQWAGFHSCRPRAHI
ncbi:hypothetical protein PMAYCL1PPCAC_20500, partial [Pristionchus mayeri]